jgi:serine/threonine protein kinase
MLETFAASRGRTTRTRAQESQEPQDTALRIPHAAPPQDPLPETQGPVLEEAITKPQVWVIPPNETEPQLQTIDVIKADNIHRNNPTQNAQAYMRIPTMARKNLDHHAPKWGCVYFGVILPQVSPGVFQAPTAEQAQLVAIKRLKKSVVDDCLAQGRRENPYKEIQRMQTLGDNLHVLGCLEALVDTKNDFLYIIMPYCEQQSLAEWIPWNQGVSEGQAQAVFSQIISSIVYLHDRGICHRDLSPDNCMIYNGRVVLIDLAMSFQIPVHPPGSGSSPTTPMGGFGKPAYLPPEVVMNLAFDAKSCDLWSSIVVLFNLLTGELLYRVPVPQDLSFRYFIQAGGVSSTPQNERTVEILLDLADDDEDSSSRQELWNKAQKCLGLSPEVLELLQGVLQVTPHNRWTEHQVETCLWMTSTP